MRRQSHLSLGQYLTHHYLSGVSKNKQQAFLLGCVEPDINPFTYIKGSVRYDFLQGHHFCNSQGYMERLARRLQRKQPWGFLEYYSLGKLVHYVADAFTHAHNIGFQGGIKEHRDYEHRLQEYFLNQPEQMPLSAMANRDTVPDLIRRLHREYSQRTPGTETDYYYIHLACCSILSILHP